MVIRSIMRFGIIIYNTIKYKLKIPGDYTTTLCPDYSSSELCPICHNSLLTNNVKLKDCNHNFHKKCIKKWLKKKWSCPMCRKEPYHC